MNPLWKMALQGRKSEFKNPWTMTRNQHPFQKYEKSCSLGFLALQSHFPERIQSCAEKGLETGQITDSRQLKKTRISGLARLYSKGFKARLYGKRTGGRQNHSFTAPHSSRTVGFPALQSHIPKDSKPALLERDWEQAKSQLRGTTQLTDNRISGLAKPFSRDGPQPTLCIYFSKIGLIPGSFVLLLHKLGSRQPFPNQTFSSNIPPPSSLHNQPA